MARWIESIQKVVQIPFTTLSVTEMPFRHCCMLGSKVVHEFISTNYISPLSSA